MHSLHSGDLYMTSPMPNPKPDSFAKASVHPFDLSHVHPSSEREKISFDMLHNKARNLENQIQKNLDGYYLHDNLSPPPELFRISENLLNELKDTIRLFGKQTASHYSIQYHQSKYSHFLLSYKRIKNCIEEKQARDNILHQANTTSNEGEFEVSLGMKMMMEDDKLLTESHRDALMIIKSGEEIKQLIHRGFKAISHSSHRLQHSLYHFKRIEGAIRTIKKAKMKNTLILASVTSCCLFIFILVFLR